MPPLLSAFRNHDSVSAAWKSGNWQPSLSNAALYSAQKNPTLGNVYLALQIKHAIDGIAVDDLATFHKLLDQSPEHARWSKVALRLLCAQLQLKNLDSAHELVSCFLPGSCKITKTKTLHRFPLALRFLAQHYPEKLGILHQKKASLAIQLTDQIACFDVQLLNGLCNQDGRPVERKRTVAIVGNGPSLLHKPNGQIIDDHDVVLRFNSPVLTEDYQRYSGKRTDVLVVSPNLAKKTPYNGINALSISGINILQGESGYWSRLAKLTPYVKLAVFNQVYWYKLVEELKAPPSAGVLAIASLANQKDLKITAFGFTARDPGTPNCASMRNIASECSNGAHYGDQQAASTRHNWTAEAALVKKLVDSTLSVSLTTE